MRMMKIMTGYKVEENLRECREAGITSLVIGVPWDLIEPHEAQAQRNHSQSLARLSERGGLGACEAVAILEDRPHRRMSIPDAQKRLAKLLAATPSQSGSR